MVAGLCSEQTLLPIPLSATRQDGDLRGAHEVHGGQVHHNAAHCSQVLRKGGCAVSDSHSPGRVEVEAHGRGSGDVVRGDAACAQAVRDGACASGKESRAILVVTASGLEPVGKAAAGASLACCLG